jgi:hypothetical protein
MNVLMLMFALAGDPATCPMHAQHMQQAPTADEHAQGTEHADHAEPANHAEHAEPAGQADLTQHAAVDARGDGVMGFSHRTTKHAFRLFADGGAVEVRATDAKDEASVAAIRAHLREIEKEFAAGNFESPRQIHDRVPDGVLVMKSLGSVILYQYEELERGGRVRITTRDARGIEAAHQFLRFQIEDHRTGDSGKVE